MTRKQALQKAIAVLEDKTAIDKIQEILTDMPIMGWSDAVIFDTVDQFVAENGRMPVATDFKQKGMPPHPVIKLRLAITKVRILF